VTISEKKEKHVSSYSIAKEWNVSLATIIRNIDRIKRASVFLSQMCTEATSSVYNGFKTLTILAGKLFAWTTLTRRWYHTFYPKRVKHILNPHNLTTKPP
jgi:hypothetical protein